VSDVLRINNYDKIPLELINSAPPAEVTPKIYDLEDKCRDILVSLGMHEHITNPLVQLDEGDKTMLKLENSLNSEQNALRTSIYSTLAPVLNVYKKHRIEGAKIFEIGKIYAKDLSETRVLEAIGPLGELRQILSAFFLNLGIDNINYKGEKMRAGIYQGSLELGEARPDSFTIYTEKLLKAKTSNLRTRAKILHRSTQDLTIELESGESLGETIQKIKSKSKMISSVELVDKFTKGDKTAYTFRVVFESEKAIKTQSLE
jgi:phenylalanyl-tRNA synthetase beta subunit